MRGKRSSLLTCRLFFQIIVKKDGKITLFCKGADSKVKERLDDSEKEIMAQTDEHLNVSEEKFLLDTERFVSLPSRNSPVTV